MSKLGYIAHLSKSPHFGRLGRGSKHIGEVFAAFVVVFAFKTAQVFYCVAVVHHLGHALVEGGSLEHRFTVDVSVINILYCPFPWGSYIVLGVRDVTGQITGVSRVDALSIVDLEVPFGPRKDTVFVSASLVSRHGTNLGQQCSFIAIGCHSSGQII